MSHSDERAITVSKKRSRSDERAIAVKKFFIKTPNKPELNEITYLMIGTIFGILLIAGGVVDFGETWFLFCIGIPLIWYAGSAWFTKYNENNTMQSNYDKAYKKAEPKPSDQQMDDWLNESLERIKAQSLSKLDLLPEQVMRDPSDPIMVVGPSQGARAALGKDDILRFSSYDIVIVYLTNYHLAAYSCTIEMATGLETKESTQEYHYKDVVSVSTQTDNSSIFKVVVDGEDNPLADYQKFSLSVASGERIEVAISLPQLEDIIKNARLAPTGAEDAVKIIRAMLREKKGGIQE